MPRRWLNGMVWLAGACLTATLLSGCSANINSSAGTNPAAFESDARFAELHESSAPAAAALPSSIETTVAPWVFAAYEGKRITTPNYEIYTTLRYESVLEQLPLFYESALHYYTTALGALPAPSQRFESFLFQDRRQWQDKTRQILPDQADLFLRLGRGGFTTRGIAILYYIDYGRRPRDTFAIAAHEGWHQYTQKTFRDNLPIWLEEGIATYMEGCRVGMDGVPTFDPHRNWERSRTLREAIRRDRLIPLDDLIRRSPQSFLENGKDQLLVYYAQVWGLVHFLNEGADGKHRAGLRELLQDASAGRFMTRLAETTAGDGSRSRRSTRSGLASVQTYFTSDMVEFEREYREYITELVGPLDRDRRSDNVARSREGG